MDTGCWEADYRLKCADESNLDLCEETSNHVGLLVCPYSDVVNAWDQSNGWEPLKGMGSR